MTDIDKLEALAKQRDEIPDESWRCRGCGRLDTRCKCDEMLAASVPALIAEIRRLRAIEAAARAYCDLTPERADETPAPLLFAKLQAALAAKETP